MTVDLQTGITAQHMDPLNSNSICQFSR